MSEPTRIPSRKEALEPEEAEAQLFLRDFVPQRYDGYYRRLYDPNFYLNNVGIDKIAELIEHGNGVLNVAESLDISGTTLRRWLNADKSRMEKVRNAHVFAGNAYAYKAERVLRNAERGSKDEITWADKMASHYRWMAEKLDREMFGVVKESDKAKSAAPIALNFNFGGDGKSELKTIEHNSSPTVDVSSILQLTEEVPNE